MRFSLISSTLKPGTPSVVSADKTSDGKCRVKIELPENVDVEDTYKHFVRFCDFCYKCIPSLKTCLKLSRFVFCLIRFIYESSPFLNTIQ